MVAPTTTTTNPYLTPEERHEARASLECDWLRPLLRGDWGAWRRTGHWEPRDTFEDPWRAAVFEALAAFYAQEAAEGREGRALSAEDLADALRLAGLVGGEGQFDYDFPLFGGDDLHLRLDRRPLDYFAAVAAGFDL